MVAGRFVYGRGRATTDVDDEVRKAIDDLVQRAIHRMEATVEQDLQRIVAAIPNPPPDLMAEVRAHEAYVQHIRDQAIRESTEGVAGTDAGSQDSRRSHSIQGTSGPAFHQLSYSAVNGAGRW